MGQGNEAERPETASLLDEKDAVTAKFSLMSKDEGRPKKILMGRIKYTRKRWGWR